MGVDVLEAREKLFLSNIALLPNLKKDDDRKQWFTQLNRTIKHSMHRTFVKPSVDDVRAHVLEQLNGR
jgi:hypothetical protein